MNCLECQDLLQRRLDGANLLGSLTLDQHLAGCQSCRSTHAAGTLMLEAFKALPSAPQLPIGFSQRLVGSVLRDRQHRLAKMRRRMWVTVGLAAAILIMVWAGNIWLPGRNAPVAAVVKNEIPAVEAVTPPHAGGSLVQPTEENVAPVAKSMDEARSNVFALTTRVVDQIKDQARPFVPNPPAFARAVPMEEPLEPTAQTLLLEAGQGVSEGLSPLSRNARRAVSFFMKELPVLDSSN